MSPENKDLFDHCDVTLISIDFETEVLVQETHDPGTAEMIARILSNSDGANPHTVDVPAGFSGVTYWQFETCCNNYAHSSGETVNVLALMRNGESSGRGANSAALSPGANRRQAMASRAHKVTANAM